MGLFSGFKKFGRAIDPTSKKSVVRRTVRSVGKPITKPLRAVKSLGRAIDPTYSHGAVGKLTAPVARRVIGSSALALTGGLTAVNPKLRRWGVDGVKAGAFVGGALLTGGVAAAGMAGAKTMIKAYAPPPEMQPSDAIQLAAEQNEEAEVRAATVTPGPILSTLAKTIEDEIDALLDFFGLGPSQPIGK